MIGVNGFFYESYGFSKGIRVIERTSLPFKVHSREITLKATKVEQRFLHVTHLLDLIYMPTEYYQNISKGIKVIECTSFYLQTDGCLADHYIQVLKLPNAYLLGNDHYCKIL